MLSYPMRAQLTVIDEVHRLGAIAVRIDDLFRRKLVHRQSPINFNLFFARELEVARRGKQQVRARNL